MAKRPEPPGGMVGDVEPTEAVEYWKARAEKAERERLLTSNAYKARVRSLAERDSEIERLKALLDERRAEVCTTDQWREAVPAEYTRAIDYFRGQDDEGLLTERARAVVEYVGWLERRLGEKATPFERVATRSEVEELRRRVEELEGAHDEGMRRLDRRVAELADRVARLDVDP